MKKLCFNFIFLLLKFTIIIASENCFKIPIEQCCEQNFLPDCPQPQCTEFILQNCSNKQSDKNLSNDLSQQLIDESKCGTAELNYYPCTSKTIANKLFASCCNLYLPNECQSMCQYETDQTKAKNLIIKFIKSKCEFKYLSTILYCASQNRDNRQCCQDLDLNSPQLQVGSRCLRMCDPSSTMLDKITKEDVTCLFNWNVIMFCHHSGIREM